MNRSARSGFIALFAAAAVALAGCASMEDFATNPEKEKTRKGAGYGAAAGAVVGLLSAGNNPFKSAMIGAAAGALVGGSVGYYMDKQEARLTRILLDEDKDEALLFLKQCLKPQLDQAGRGRLIHSFEGP